MSVDTHEDERNRKQLLLTQRHLTEVPAALCRDYGKYAEYLDLSHNRIANFGWIHGFEKLKYLVLDCNRLRESHLQRIARPLRNILVLMLNKNELSDLENTACTLAQIFPNLEYLSLHGNPICPDGLDLQPFSQNVSYEYDYYRTRLLGALPRLKFLDHTAVQHAFVGSTPQRNARILTFTPKMLWARLRGSTDAEAYRPLPDSPQRHVGYHCGCIRKLSAVDYQYNGTASEGNRFISNNDL